MATIQSTLTLRDQMSAVLQRTEKASIQTEKAFASINNRLDEMDKKSQKTSASTTSLFKGMLLANVASSAISKLANVITSQLGSAIKRFDTLNNYTNVMSNLGVSTEAADKSRERLAAGLKGLPTTLDSAALAVQRFTAANGSVEASTEMYLAMNNALLAGGASTEIQASAMEQLAQAYSKGKPDMMEWRALLQAMPGQLKQIAKAMGKTTTELGEDLRSGKTSMNEFMKTVVQLNTEGIDGFKNFEEQARGATGGIQTAIANMQASIARGWTSMISEANKSLEASGLPTLQEIIKNLGDAIEELMVHIGQDLLPSLGEGLNTLSEQLGHFAESTVQNVSKSADIWDYFMIGFNAVKLGFLTGLSYMQTGALVIVYGLLVVFRTLERGITGAISACIHIVQDGVNIVIDLLNVLISGFNYAAEAINNVFGWAGAHVEQADLIEYKTFADDFDATAVATDNAVSKNMDDVKNKLFEIEDKRKQWQIEAAADTVIDTYNRLHPEETGNATQQQDATKQASFDYNQMEDLLDDVTSSDSTGGKAIKTTTNDDLLSDDDIKLLLDVATRDYKLNYQQVTPNITLTFGDIRETADVDDMLDKMADRLEEIYDANLEVSTT